MLEAKDSLLLMDDDPAFGKIVTAVAKSKGFDAHWYASLIDMGSFARMRCFDIAIIDYYLESLRGDEVAEYVDTFFADIPVLIVSGQTLDQKAMERWPSSVKGFVAKAKGPEHIIETAQKVLRRDRLLKRWLTTPPNGRPRPSSNLA